MEPVMPSDRVKMKTVKTMTNPNRSSNGRSTGNQNGGRRSPKPMKNGVDHQAEGDTAGNTAG